MYVGDICGQGKQKRQSPGLLRTIGKIVLIIIFMIIINEKKNMWYKAF